ncbi:MAG TPA: SCO family protein [Bryobacteraceae bacterium]|nr:SCO family protein [Bryobacteraceae bacterium]
MYFRRLLPVVLAMAAVSAAAAAQRFHGAGMAISVDLPKQSVTISHQAIAGYMDAMVMPFHVKNAAELKGVAPGAKVEFTLVVDQGSTWIEQLRSVDYWSAERDPEQAHRLSLIESILNKSAEHKLRRGDAVPDFTLTDQDNRPVRLSQFRGKVIAMNFVYTRCPLPDYCFRLSNNLAQVQKRFRAELGRNLILLTITFDPVRDTPQVLAKYAHIWNADLRVWHFLTGPLPEVRRVCGLFGVAAWQDEGILTHSLHTVVIDRKGKLAANIEGNTYTVKQLEDLVEQIIKTH